MTPNQKWNVPGSSQPSESTAPQNEETITSQQKPVIEPTPSQVGKFQAAVGQQSKKKTIPTEFEETAPTREEAEAAAESSLFGLAHSAIKTPTSSKPSTKGSIQPLISPIAGTGEGEAELENVETLEMPSDMPVKSFDTSTTPSTKPTPFFSKEPTKIQTTTTTTQGTSLEPPKTTTTTSFSQGTTQIDTTKTIGGPEIVPKNKTAPFFSKEPIQPEIATTETPILPQKTRATSDTTGTTALESTAVVGASQVPPKAKPAPFITKGTDTLETTSTVNGPHMAHKTRPTPFFSKETSIVDTSTTIDKLPMSPQTTTASLETKGTTKIDTTAVGGSQVPPKAKTSFFGAKAPEIVDTTTVGPSQVPPKTKTSFFGTKAPEIVDTSTVAPSQVPPKAKTSVFGAKAPEMVDTTTVGASQVPPKVKTSFFGAKAPEMVDTTTVGASQVSPPKAKTSVFGAKAPEPVDTTTVGAAQVPPKTKTPTSLSQGEEETKISEEIPEEASTSLLASKGPEAPKEPISKEDVLATAFQTIAEKVSTEKETLHLATNVSKEKTEKEKFDKNLTQPGVQQPLPTRAPQAQVAPKPTELSPNARQLTLQQLVNQVAEHITTMTTKHLETLTVDIKYPPLFAGAQITITQFKQARGEFNITFNNLSPEARLLIESGAQQRRLNDALTEKGYKIHIISIEAPHIETAAFEKTPSGFSREDYEAGAETGGNLSGEDEHGQPSGQ